MTGPSFLENADFGRENQGQAQKAKRQVLKRSKPKAED